MPCFPLWHLQFSSCIPWVPSAAASATPFHYPGLVTLQVQIGVTYPERIIVDLNAARAQNIEAITNAKLAGAACWADAGGYDMILVPAGASVRTLRPLLHQLHPYHSFMQQSLVTM